MQHPILSLANLAIGTATTAFIASGEAVQANPNLAALATIMGSVATILSAWVAYRHPRKKSRAKQPRKPRVNSDANQPNSKHEAQ